MEEAPFKTPQLYLHDVYFARFAEPFVPQWLKPNHLTVLRFCMTPVVLYFLMTQQFLLGIPLFFVAALTDMIDGSLARVRRQITEWGIAYDPIADKLLIGSTLALLILTQVRSSIAVFLLAIEGVLLLSNVAVRQFNIVRPATLSGKIKMLLEVIGIVFLLFATAMKNHFLLRVSLVLLSAAIIAAFFSILSGLLYVKERSQSPRTRVPSKSVGA